jgi:hypothetical protein
MADDPARDQQDFGIFYVNITIITSYVGSRASVFQRTNRQTGSSENLLDSAISAVIKSGRRWNVTINDLYLRPEL